MDERTWGRGRGGAHAEPPPTDDALAWIGGALPDDWFTAAPEVVIDRDEIVIVGTLAGPRVSETATDGSERVDRRPSVRYGPVNEVGVKGAPTTPCHASTG